MSTQQNKVLSIRRKLEKMQKNGDQDQVMDLLSQLRDIDMNMSILSNTGIAHTVNVLRKSKSSSNSEVISLAKSLIKAWKKSLPESGLFMIKAWLKIVSDRKEKKDVNSKCDKSHHAHCTEKKSSNGKRAKNSESDKTLQFDHLKMASKKKSQEAHQTVEAWLPWVEDLVCQLCQRSPQPEDQKWFKCTEHYYICESCFSTSLDENMNAILTSGKPLSLGFESSKDQSMEGDAIKNSSSNATKKNDVSSSYIWKVGNKYY